MPPRRPRLATQRENKYSLISRQRRRKQRRNRHRPRFRRGKTTRCQRSRAFSSVSLGAPLHHQHLSSRTHLAKHLRPRHRQHLVMHHQHLRLMHHRLNLHLHNWTNCLKNSLTPLMLVRSQRRLLIHRARVRSFSVIHRLLWALPVAVIQKILGLLGTEIGCGVVSAMSLGWCHAGNF